MDFKERFRFERERLGFSQPKLGELLSVGKTTVINWEKGASSPDAAQLLIFVAAGADPLFLLADTRDPARPALDQAERVLIDSYRLCTHEARQHLIQTAALLAAGGSKTVVPAARPSTSIRVSSNRGHAAGRDININQETKHGKKGDKLRR